MADDIVTRLRNGTPTAVYVIANDAADEIERLTAHTGELSTRYVELLDYLDATRLERDRLRAAIDALLTDIDSDHRPVWPGGAKATGKQPWCCAWCGAADGGWPCVHRRALDELKEAHRG